MSFEKRKRYDKTDHRENDTPQPRQQRLLILLSSPQCNSHLGQTNGAKSPRQTLNQSLRDRRLTKLNQANIHILHVSSRVLFEYFVQAGMVEGVVGVGEFDVGCTVVLRGGDHGGGGVFWEGRDLHDGL